MVYETLEADGEPLRTGRVLSTEFRNNGKTYEAMWFQEPEASKGLHTLEGESMRRAVPRLPVEFFSVTSGFKMRMHPDPENLARTPGHRLRSPQAPPGAHGG